MRDGQGKVSALATDAIVLDTLPPEGCCRPSPSTAARYRWSAAAGAGWSVLGAVCGSTAPAAAARKPGYEGAGLTTTPQASPTAKTYAFRLRHRRAWQRRLHRPTTATPAGRPGDTGTLSINDGAYWTRSRVVELEMGAIEGATEMCVSNSSRRDLEMRRQFHVVDPSQRAGCLDPPLVPQQHRAGVFPVTASVGLDSVKPSER